MSAKLDQVMQALPNTYQDKNRLRNDIAQLIALTPSLTPEHGTFSGGGRTVTLFYLAGVIPITYSGSNYNIPVTIYFDPPYPRQAPRCFVTPTQGMALKSGHPNVDQGGMIYMPYLSTWNLQSSSLAELMTTIASAFSAQPPVHSTATAAAEDQAFNALMRAAGLDDQIDVLRASGFDTVAMLTEATNEDLLMDGFGKGHLKKLRKILPEGGYGASPPFLAPLQNIPTDLECESATKAAPLGLAEGHGQSGADAMEKAQVREQQFFFERYCGHPTQIRLGNAAAAARGIDVLLGVTGDEVGTWLTKGEVQAIEREFETNGSPKDKENLRCVLGGEKLPEWERGASLAELLEHSDARQSGLKEHHVLALRLYSTSSFACLNDPLRNIAEPFSCLNEPHPFAATVYFIKQGIELLRVVHANSPDKTKERVYWRGMKDVGISNKFKEEGGTDFACVSTTASQEVAVTRFAKSNLPLVFKIVTKTFMDRGADISFLSVYPSEKGCLYPPLTYLRCLKMEEEKLWGVQLLVATVEPRFG